MQFFVVMTVKIPADEQMVTFTKMVTAEPGSSRAQIYDDIYSEICGHFGMRYANSNVIFFSAEPNIMPMAPD